ncbi:MAG: NAD(P)/FAD-dependent oxidoreductase [Bacteroidota bacterium]
MKYFPTITILGAGLTGLTIAYLLRDQPFDVRILEARDRVGGRILTDRKPDRAPVELGATWLGQQHTALNAFLAKEGLPIFEQVLGRTAIYEAMSTSPPQLVELPVNNDPSYRIAGGTSTLIQYLVDQLPPERIQLNTTVGSVKSVGDRLEVYTNQGTYPSDYVVSTLPPFLLHSTIQFDPALPIELNQIMANTHTWMGESIKVALRFQEPFWRKPGASGTIFSNVGPITEFYDHSNVEDNHYALKGFLNGGYFHLDKEQRLEIVLNQLRKYYGSAVDQFTEYEEAVWRNESFTFAEYHRPVLPHQNNGHPIYQQAYLDGKFFIAGAETAGQFPGYMDGAIRSAQQIFNHLTE